MLIRKIKIRVLELISVFLIIATFLRIDANAQINQNPENLVNWSPEGMVAFASDAGLSEESPQSGRTEAVIYRKLSEEGEYDEIARLQAPESVEELNYFYKYFLLYYLLYL